MKYFSLILATTLLLGGSGDAMAKASAAMKAGLFNEALAHINEAQRLDQANPDVYRMKAFLHEVLDQPKLALTAWKSCLDLSKDEKLSTEAKIHILILSETL